ncbi:hypothetical protein DOY81_012046 [Sarcophaga bullata]|nr:hypothetical protein DOY81_012046 [Sarcophaga bullata]
MFGQTLFNLADERQAKNAQDTAILRLESLCRIPAYELQQEIAKYKNASTFVWSQEEHRNMGAWSFVKPRFENLVGKQVSYRFLYFVLFLTNLYAFLTACLAF